MTVIACVPLLFLGMQCPDPEPAPPPPPGAPHIDSLRIDAVLAQKSLRPVVRIHWSPPRNDSIVIQRYVLLRITDAESLFSEIKYFPPGIKAYGDPMNASFFPADQMTEVRLTYRLYAVDSLFRIGDTSSAESVIVTFPPVQERPVNDTVTDGRPRFLWQVMGHNSEYYTWATVWNSTGPVWHSVPVSDFGMDNNWRPFTAGYPDTGGALAPGRYFWAARIEDVTGSWTTAGSITLDSFHVE